MASADLRVWKSGQYERKENLLLKIGGKQVLHDAVELFYNRLLNDKDLKNFFQNTDMSILKWHQLNLMTVAFGDVSPDFNVENMILQRHQRFFDQGLEIRHFELFVEHFVNTLKELELDPDVVGEATKVLQDLRPAFVKGHEQAQIRDAARKRTIVLQVVAISSVLGLVALRFFRMKK